MSYPCHTWKGNHWTTVWVGGEVMAPESSNVGQPKRGPKKVPREETGVIALDFANYADEIRRVRGRMGR